MKLKALIAALAIGSAGMVGTANAAIETPAAGDSIDNSAAGSGSELIFFAVTATQSYTRDLGIGFNDINSLSSFSFSDSTLSSIIGDVTSWGVVAFDVAGNGTSNTASDWGVRLLATSPSGSPVITNNVDLANTNQNAAGFLSDLNGQGNDDPLLGPLTGHAGLDNGSFLVGSGDPGSVQGITGLTLPASFGGDVGSSLAFFLYSQIGTLDSNPFGGTSFDPTDLSSTLLGQWTLGTNGDLSFAGANPIPVPAAVWLMGSALVGLVGIGRRKQS